MRIAAVGDLHCTVGSAAATSRFESLPSEADILLLAGDVTMHGAPEEAQLLARELAPIAVPKVAVLGNHDYHLGAQDAIRSALESADVQVLEGSGTRLDVNGARVAIGGTKGFGGGFLGASGSDFGEPEMKAFIRHTKSLAATLRAVLSSLEGDLRVALLHYSPVEETLRGERFEIYPFLGSYLLGDAIDQAGAHIAFHGHAHGGCERGVTPGGVSVRNVSLPVIGGPYNVYRLRVDA